MRLQGDRLPEICADRVKLRWLEPSDTRDLFEIFSNKEVCRYWSSPPMKEAAEAGRLIADIHEMFVAHTLYEWGVARVRDDRIIGTLTLASLDEKNRRAEVGFSLARSAWGNGYMREAIKLGLDFAFDQMDLMRVEADVDPNNTNSLRLLEDMSFKREGYLRERWRVAGEVTDSVLLGLLRREWQARDEAGPADS